MNGKTIGFVHGFIFKGEIIWTLSNLGMKGLEMSYNSQNNNNDDDDDNKDLEIKISRTWGLGMETVPASD